MLFNKAIQFAVLSAAILVDTASSATIKICGRRLSEMMIILCPAHNSLVGNAPAVVEQPGVADECCVNRCTLDQFLAYCPVTAYSDSPLDDMAHIIADRSAEQGATDTKVASPAVVAAASLPAVGKAGHATGRRGGSRPRGSRRGRRCWCRRKRRSGRRRSSLMGSRKKCSTSRCARGGHRLAAHHLGPDTQH